MRKAAVLAFILAVYMCFPALAEPAAGERPDNAVKIERETGHISQPVAEYTFPEKGFHESTFRFNLVYGGYIVNPWGEMMSREKDLFEENRSFLSSGTIFNNEEVSYSSRNMAFEADYLFSSIKYCQRIVFDFTGLKFGVRGRYSFSRINQYIYLYPEGGEPLFKASGRFSEYKNIEAGPTIDIIFSPRSNDFNVLIHSYLLVGYIFDGSLSAVAAQRDAGVAYQRSQYSAGFSGSSISLGLGPHFLLNRWVPVTIGFNLKYTHTKLFLDRSLPVYGNKRNTSFNSLGIELSFGAHFL